MPIDEPIERMRLYTPAASVASARGSVAKATADSGMNTKPTPNPWSSSGTMVVRPLASRLMPVIIHAPTRLTAMPKKMRGLAPKRPSSRPTMSMLARLPMPRGTIARPVSNVGNWSSPSKRNGCSSMPP